MLKERFGKFDLVLHNYNAAGPYPSCFSNLTEKEKVKEHERILDRNFQYMLKNCEELECKMVLPFAGAYVLGGALAKKNHYLGTTTWDVCANYLKKHLKNDTEVICLRENDEIDLISRNRNNTYIPIDHNEMEIYINEKLSKVKYDYELEPVVNYSALKKDLILASKKMSERCKKILLIPDMDVEIEIDGKKINICKVDESKGLLSCSLDPRLLRKILDRAAHWNNAEIGCHIEFNRVPNYYSPDMHTMLQFLHL